jgi:quercetin dioxygenase-like cupin family protein
MPPDVTAVDPQEAEFADAWIDGDGSARWRSAQGLGPSKGAQASGSSLLEVPSGCRLPRHIDTAEETFVVTEGVAEVVFGENAERLRSGGMALVPANEPHEVRNAGDGTLRFAAVYASTDVTTRYEQPVEPDGSRERSPVA